MPMSPASGMQEALREVVGKEIMVVVISQCEFLTYHCFTHLLLQRFMRSATGVSYSATSDLEVSRISKLMIRRRTSSLPTIHSRSSPS